MTIENFEDIFVHIGGFGRYQFTLFGTSCLLNLFVSLVYYGQFFMTLTPPHWCRPPPAVLSLGLPQEDVMLLTLPPAEGESGYQSCFRYDVDFMQVVLQNESWPDPSWPLTSCDHGWNYDYSLHYPTITSELDWVCDNDWKPALSQSIFLFGAAIGCPIFGWAADVWGRVPAIIFANMLGGLAGMACTYCQSFGAFSALRFVVGLTYDQHYMIGFILLMEYVGNEYRTMMNNIPTMIFATTTMCLIPWIAWSLANWHLLVLVLHSPQLFSVFFIWFVPESARWLISKGRVEDTVKIIKKAAKINGRPLKPQVIKDFQEFGEKQSAIAKQEGDATILDILRAPVLRKRFLVLCVMMMVITVSYDECIRNTENIGPNVFVSFTLAGLVEFPADLLNMFLVEWVGRRHTTLFSLVFGGLASLAVTLFPEDNTVAIMVLAFIGRFMVTMAVDVGHQYSVEILPTVARGQGNGMMKSLGFLAAFSSPYIVYLHKYGKYIPFLIIGIITTFGGFSCLLLPETLNENLPNSIKDGDTFFTDQPLCYNPFSRKRSAKMKDEDGGHTEGTDNPDFEDTTP